MSTPNPGSAPGPKVWLLNLILPGRYGRYLSSLLIFVAVLLLLALAEPTAGIGGSTSLFFSVITAYMIPVLHYIIAVQEEALDELEPSLDIAAGDLAQLRQRLSHRSLGWNAGVVGLGALCGLCHEALMSESWNPSELLDPEHAGTLLVWVVMNTAIFTLVENAVRFGRLGRDHARVNILSREGLAPLATVAVAPTIMIIGSQALFPLMFLGGDANWLAFWPGMLASALPMLAMLLLPVWPVHQRIQVLKREELARVSRAVAVVTAQEYSLQDYEHLQRRNVLLQYRAQLVAVPEWPAGMGALARLGFYLVIPPLTWFGAALIENLVEVWL